VGTTRPLYASTAGRLLLAYAEKKWLDSYLASVVFKTKTAIPVSRGALRQELEKIRAEGVSWSIDGYMKGLSAVAGPVFDASGRCVASLNIAGPSERFRSELDFLKMTVKEVTSKASGVIGSINAPTRKKA
jgi:IclR family transcriptional regulator, acetate operon repressor